MQHLAPKCQNGKIRALIILGDFVDWGADSYSWQVVLSLFERYAPQVPLFSIAGNHDMYGGGLKYWFRYFMFTNKKQQLPYWYLHQQDVHIIGMFLPWSFRDADKAQKAWLLQTLSQIPDTHFVIILTHSFFYASGYYDFWSGGAWYDNTGKIKHIAPLFTHKADLIVSRHNHYMEWIEQDDTNWAIVGAMGGKPDPEPSYITQGSRFFKRNAFGVLCSPPVILSAFFPNLPK